MILSQNKISIVYNLYQLDLNGYKIGLLHLLN